MLAVESSESGKAKDHMEVTEKLAYEAPKEDVKEESLLSVVEGTSVVGNFTKDGSWQQGLPKLKIILFLVENG